MADRVPETIGELGIILVRVEKALETMVTRSTFEAEQERTREEFRDVRQDHTEWTAESRAAHTEISAEVRRVEREQVIAVSLAKKEAQDAVAALADQMDKQEKAQRESKQRFLLAIAGMVLSLAIAIAGWVVPG